MEGKTSSKYQQKYRLYMPDKSVPVPKTTEWREKRPKTHAKELHDEEVSVSSMSNSLPLEVNGMQAVDEYHHFVNSFHEKEFQIYLDDPALSELVNEDLKDEEDNGLGGNDDDDDDDDDDDNQCQPDEPDYDSHDTYEEILDGDTGRPLYTGASITLAASMVLIITFAMRHSLTGEALADLLQLIEVHCLTPNLCQRTLKSFMNCFRAIRSPLEFHYYCQKCFNYHGQQKVDNCAICNSRQVKEQGYFLVIPLVNQLSSILNDSLLHQIISFKKEHLSRHDGIMKDVMDGRLYKDLFQDGYLRGIGSPDEIHISLQVNTDGVSIFKSSSFSIWPVYFIINELPPNMRFSRNNRIFAGLWFGYSKPDFKAFLRPFAESLHDLYFRGSIVNGTRVRLILLSGVFDAPARCLFLDMIQFNGYHGCPYCLTPGQSLKTSERGHSHIYPFNYDSMTGHGDERTHAMSVQHATHAEEKKCTAKSGNVYGVKGASWSHHLPKFDIVRGVAVDYMHCIMLGVMKMLMMLWFNRTYKSETYSVYTRIHEVNSRLLRIKPANFIARLPRTLIDLSHYKAAEYKSFMLFYSLPCLWGILPEIYIEHFTLLLKSVVIMLSVNITEEELSNTRTMLMEFCMNIPILYGDRYMTSNVHLLLHLTDKVRDLGPLWTMSCFYFEDFNGQLRNLFHGTQNIQRQITFAVSVHQKLPLLASVFKYGTGECELFKKMFEKKPMTLKEMITDHIFVVGAYNYEPLSLAERNVIVLELGNLQNVSVFKRLSFHNEVIHSMAYKAVKKRNSTYIKYMCNNRTCYGQIRRFVKVKTACQISCYQGSGCTCKPQFLAIVHEFMEQTVLVEGPSHILSFALNEDNVKAVYVSNINSLCTSIIVDNIIFLCTRPNRHEKE